MFIFAAVLLTTAIAALNTVYVVPHSHCEHGGLDTMDAEYNDLVENILDNVVNLLDGHPRRKFVWAEVAYFSKWYAE